MDRKEAKFPYTGAPGSHSALFGLTPDGHFETEATYGSPMPKPVQSTANISNCCADEPAGTTARTYRHTASHSALFGLIPDEPKEMDANMSSSKTKLGQRAKNDPLLLNDGHADTGADGYHQTVSHSALFGLIPDLPKENEAKNSSSKRKGGSSVEEKPFSTSDGPANVGAVSHRHTVSDSALFGLIPEPHKSNMAESTLSKPHPVCSAENCLSPIGSLEFSGPADDYPSSLVGMWMDAIVSQHCGELKANDKENDVEASSGWEAANMSVAGDGVPKGRGDSW